MLRLDFDTFFLGTAMIPVFRQRLAKGARPAAAVARPAPAPSRNRPENGERAVRRPAFAGARGMDRQLRSRLPRIVVQRQRQALRDRLPDVEHAIPHRFGGIVLLGIEDHLPDSLDAGRGNAVEPEPLVDARRHGVQRDDAGL